MKAFLRAAGIGGLVLAGAVFVAGVGVAQGPASSSPPAAAPATPPASTATAADDAKADPACRPAEIACAWSSCYPINESKYHSLTACITQNCKPRGSGLHQPAGPGRLRSRPRAGQGRRLGAGCDELG